MTVNTEPIPTGVRPGAEIQPSIPVPTGAPKSGGPKPADAAAGEALGRRVEQTAAQGPDVGLQTIARGASEPAATPELGAEVSPEATTSPEADPRVKSFKTEKGSVYTYDADGKTTRFKTATGEQNERQDLTIFANLTPEEEQQVRNVIHLEGDHGQKVYIVERLADDNAPPRVLRDLSEVTNPNALYLGVFRDGKTLMIKKASLKPTVGADVFDNRSVTDENGVQVAREIHLGNKVTEIEYEQPAATEAAGPEVAPVASATGEQPPIEPPDAPPATGETPDQAGGPEANATPPADTVAKTDSGDAEATKPPEAAKPDADGPLFTFEAEVQAKWDEEKEKAGGNLSVQDDELFEARRLQAAGKDELYASSSNKVIAEKALGGRLGHLASRVRLLAGRGTSADQTAVKARGDLGQKYKEKIFDPLKRASKTKNSKPYEELLGNAYDDANETAKQFKTELNEAIESGKDQATIDKLRSKHEAANQHFVMIRDEKRKRWLRNSLLGILLVAISTGIKDSAGQAKDGLQQPTPQRR